MKNDGIFIVIEGADGSGKATQFNLLVERLKASGYDVAVFDFPQYDLDSSYFIKQYLDGKYGEADTISPYAASMFYALDRFEAAPKIKKALSEGKVIVSNRYVASNMAHQGGKFGTEAQKRGFFLWEDGLEFNTLGIPRPDLNIYLRVPAEKSHQLILKRQKDKPGRNDLDQHEANLQHLKKAVDTYDLLTNLFPKDFETIDCVVNNQLLSVPRINNLIWDAIKPLLPPNPPNEGYDTVLDLTKLTESNIPKKAPHQAPKQIAASQPSNKTDDQLEIKNISLLAADLIKLLPDIKMSTKLKWPSSQPGKGFYTFGNLSNDLLFSYKKYNDHLSRNYRLISEKISANSDGSDDNIQKRQALLNVTPLFALTDVVIKASKHDITSIQSTLIGRGYDESRWLAGQMNNAISDKNFERNVLNEPKKADLLEKTAAKLNQDNISKYSDQKGIVEMIGYNPKNEFDLLEIALFKDTNLPKEVIRTYLNNLKYDDKYNMLLQVFDSLNAEVLNQISYNWQLSATVSSAISLHRAISNTVILGQKPSASLGFEIPDIIKDHNLTETYENSFELSQNVIDEFRSAGKYELEPYLTLGGHVSRWQLNTTAADMIRLLGGQAGSKNHRRLIKLMQAKINEVHPIFSDQLVAVKSKKPARSANKYNSGAKKSAKTKPIT